MQKFRQVFDFYINSSIHVSLAVVALALVTGYGLNISLQWPLLVFLFCSTVTGYNFVKYAEVAGLHHRSLAQSLKTIQVFSAICGMGMVIFLFYLRWEVLVAGGFLGLLTLLYALPFLSHHRNLRKISGLKIYIIAVVWAGVTVLLPVLESGLMPYWDVWVMFAQRLLFVLVLMIPFEIRDIAYDDRSLKTLPQVVGIKKAKFIGMTWLLLFFFLEFLRDELDARSVLIHLSISIIVGVSITLSRKRQSPYFASFWVEAIPLVWLWIVIVSLSF